MADDGSWNDTHRAFLQAFIARGTITFEESRPVLARIQSAYERRNIQPGDITEEDFGNYISAISSAVSPLDYEIRSITHQVTKVKVWAFINAASDGLTQAATGFTADEIAFITRVLDAIFTTHNTKKREICAIKGTDALQLYKPRDGQGNTQANGATQSGGSNGAITMGNAEAVLKGLVSQGWFDVSKKGYYSLSPRTLMELRGWLIETFNDNDESEEEGQDSRYSGERIKMCQACKEIVTVGQRCPDKSCPIRLHDMCTERFFRMQKSTTCPKCKKDWKDHGVVGEKAAQTNAPRTSTTQNTTPSGRGANITNGTHDENGDAMEED